MRQHSRWWVFAVRVLKRLLEKDNLAYDVSTEVFSRKQTMALLTMIITANAAFALADI